MAHNNVVEVLSDYGIIAFIIEEILILIPIISVFMNGKENKKERVVVLVFSIYILLMQLFLVEIDSKAEMIFLPLCYYFLIPINDQNIKNKLFIHQNHNELSYYEIVI